MNLKQRINRYLIGVGLGIVLSIAFFGQRNWTGWMPGNRVLDRLAATYTPDSKGKCLMECHKVSHSDLETLLGSGKVEFDLSNAKSEPKLYAVKHAKRKDLIVWFEAAGENARVTRIQSGGNPKCACP